MANINIQWAAAAGQAERLGDCKRRLEEAGSRMNRIQASGAFSKGNMSLYRRRIKDIIREIEDQSAGMESLRSGLNQIVEKYKSTERRLSDLGGSASGSSGGGGMGGRGGNNYFKFEALPIKIGRFAVLPAAVTTLWKTDAIWDMVGEFGAVGKAVKYIRKGAAGKWSWTDGLKLGLDGIGKAAKAVGILKKGEWGTKWKDFLFGISSEKQSFGEWMQKSYLGDGSGVGNVQAAVKWAGLGLTALQAGIRQGERVADGKVGAGEAFLAGAAETALEAGIGIAAAALLGPGLPAAGAAIAAKWVADTVVQHVTNDPDAKFTQVAADWFSNKVVNGTKAVCNWAKSLFNPRGSYRYSYAGGGGGGDSW